MRGALEQPSQVLAVGCFVEKLQVQLQSPPLVSSREPRRLLLNLPEPHLQPDRLYQQRHRLPIGGIAMGHS